ncbi:hypothetical protein O1157_00940 [Streptomyces albogriseolus]
MPENSWSASALSASMVPDGIDGRAPRVMAAPLECPYSGVPLSLRFSMVNMLMWILDLGLAVLMPGLEVAALVAFWFVEGMKKWAAKGGPVPGATSRFLMVLSGGRLPRR